MIGRREIMPCQHTPGCDAEEPQTAYHRLFASAPAENAINELHPATQGGWAIGSEPFKAQIAEISAHRAAPQPKGRGSAEVLRDRG